MGNSPNTGSFACRSAALYSREIFSRQSSLIVGTAMGTPTGKMPPCTVVVCTRNRPSQLETCLASLFQLKYPNFDVLVVDNAPSDNRTRQVASSWNAGYAYAPVIGLARARNLGARVCKSEFLAYLDDDSLPEPSWLA